MSGQTPFYQGKPVQICVGFAAGGGSMVAANYVYGVAKPDRLTLSLEAKKKGLDATPASGADLATLTAMRAVRTTLYKFLSRRLSQIH